VTVETRTHLDGDLAEQAWKLYDTAMAPLNQLAVQRHLMHRSEFNEVATDRRVDKVLTYDNDASLIGLATFTNHLDAVPLISPAYFEHHWPDLYREHRIWYIGFVVVADHARTSPAFVEAFAHYYRVAAAADGIIGLDVCAHNETTRRLPLIIALQLRRISDGNSRYRRADEQSYWIYDMNGRHL
jgi:hypothetical protein